MTTPTLRLHRVSISAMIYSLDGEPDYDLERAAQVALQRAVEDPGWESRIMIEEIDPDELEPVPTDKAARATGENDVTYQTRIRVVGWDEP